MRPDQMDRLNRLCTHITSVAISATTAEDGVRDSLNEVIVDLCEEMQKELDSAACSDEQQPQLKAVTR